MATVVQPVCTSCGHDDITHSARMAAGVVGGLVYGGCFAQAADQPQCPCDQYLAPAGERS